MDRMSIGPFIAALRKARGLTQKELAAMLSVSDKTVSRWETGDGTPELALIPVLAEIFVTSSCAENAGRRTETLVPPLLKAKSAASGCSNPP